LSASCTLTPITGDIVAQSDGTGTLTWTASYEAYGKRTKETGTNADKQRANTKDEDPTGLLNEGFRYRDIETGVWLSRDPAGFVDGPNLYAYVRQNPWTAWDPHGLESYHWYHGGAMREHLFDPVYNTATNHASNNTKTSIAGALSGVVRGGIDVVNMVANRNGPLAMISNPLAEMAKQGVSDASASLFGVDGKSQAFTDSQTTGEIFSPVPGGVAVKGTKVVNAGGKTLTKLVKTAAGTVDETAALVDNLAPQTPIIAANGGDHLVRFGKGPETTASLAEQAAAAKANPAYGVHGVSTKRVPQVSGSDKKHRRTENGVRVQLLDKCFGYSQG
jgi:RHS repeat-associated protein